MKVDTTEEISRWLEQGGGLAESLMRELRLDKFGYSVHIAFSVIVDAAGRVLETPLELALDLDGVQQLTLRSGLTPRMLEHPDEIGWGLSEVALVRVASSDVGVRFEALWEGERRIEVECRRATLEVVQTPPKVSAEPG
ncbi:hypothetical protein [Nocardioides speluncae]|uniref:hypothetical protein n=1 Tax=Nocardioides speluncae TaxID=2670337 RepID=UPI000D68C061|nr:hypothetical protein [Nocardioides speluncae]